MIDPLTLQLLDVDFTIRCYADEWRDFLAQLWAPFLKPANDGGANQVEVEGDFGGWTMRFFGESAVLDHDPWSLANELRNAMFQRTLERSPNTIAVHAAVVERGGTGMLLCGPAGTGKSSLTLALLDHGWSYLSDDFAPISIESERVLPMPKPIHSKNPDVWEQLLERWQPPPWVPFPSRSFLVPATAFRLTKEPIVAGIIAFPRFEPSSTPSLRSMTAAEATARCSANLHGLNRLDHLALGIVARLGSAARACELVYGSSADALEMVDRLVPHPGRMR